MHINKMNIKVQDMLKHLLSINKLQMVWLYRIGQHSILQWKLDSLTCQIVKEYKRLSGMRFFEEIHGMTQVLLDDINEMYVLNYIVLLCKDQIATQI